MGAEPDRTLHADERPAPEGSAQAVVEKVDGGGVAVADRGHHGNFALEEFDAVVLGEDAGGPHAVELVDREAVGGSDRPHARPLGHSSAPRRPAPTTQPEWIHACDELQSRCGTREAPQRPSTRRGVPR